MALAPEERAARRQRYIDALWRIAEHEGVERASMRTIAGEAGTSVGMLQYHFTDKDEILASAIRTRLATKHTLLNRAISRLGPDPEPAAVLAVAMRHRLPLTAKLETEARVLAHWLGSGATPLKEEVLLDSERVLSEVITCALTQAQRNGGLSPDLDVEVLTSGLVAMNDGLMRGLMLGRCTSTQATAIIETHLQALLIR